MIDGSCELQQRRQQIEHYFDRTAADVWARLTSDEPVSGIRETVRAGREEMRNTLLSWLPEDLSGRQVLDAGCGTGVISIELAKRGAEVIAVDLSQSLIELANERYSTMDEYHRIQFIVGDMRQLEGERFDHVLAMDSIIHYAAQMGFGRLRRWRTVLMSRWYSLSHPRPCRSRRCTLSESFSLVAIVRPPSSQLLPPFF